MLVIMHFASFISHYAGFGTHSKLSNFWVASDSLWVEPLLGSFKIQWCHDNGGKLEDDSKYGLKFGNSKILNCCSVEMLS